MAMPTFYRYLYKLAGKLVNKRMIQGISRKRVYCIMLPTLEDARDRWRYIMADPHWSFPVNDDDDDSDSDVEVDESTV